MDKGEVEAADNNDMEAEGGGIRGAHIGTGTHRDPNLGYGSRQQNTR